MKNINSKLFTGSIFFVSSVFLLCLTGCSSVDYNRITSDCEDKHGTGIRYYDTSPYLLVQRDTNSQWVVQALYLPDPTKKSEVNVTTYFAVTTVNLGFSNAVLSSSSVTSDPTAVPVGVVQAAAQVAIGLADSAKGVVDVKLKKPISPSVFLFKIIKDDKGWGLTGASGPNLDLLDPQTDAPTTAGKEGESPKNNR